MKILFFTTFWPQLGGAETFLKILVDDLVKKEHKPVVAANEITSNNDIDNIPLYKIPAIRNSITGIFDKKIYSESKKIFEKEKPDICHIIIMQRFGFSPIRCARELGIPVIFTMNDYFPLCGNAHLFHNSKCCNGKQGMVKCFFCEFISSDPRYRKNLFKMLAWGFRNVYRFRYKKYLKMINKIVYPSIKARDISLFLGAPSKSASVIHYPYIPAYGSETIKHNKYESLKREGYITGGRLVRYKGIEFAIDIFNELKLPLKILGEGEYKNELQKKTGPSIQFIGFKSQPELLHILSRCRAYISPSLWPETGGPPFIIMDCYAVGTPVIATDVGGHIEGIVDNKTGFIFRHDEFSQLKEKIHLIENGWQPDTAIMNNFLSKRNASQKVDSYIELYKKLLMGKK